MPAELRRSLFRPNTPEANIRISMMTALTVLTLLPVRMQ